MNDSFMDYVMRFDGKNLPVETKLSVANEPHILNQVSKYVYNSNVYLTQDGKRCVTGASFHDGKVLIIDTEKLYMFDSATNTIDDIFDLDNLIGKSDLDKVKQAIRSNL